jgi:hypothetical protein
LRISGSLIQYFTTNVVAVVVEVTRSQETVVFPPVQVTALAELAVGEKPIMVTTPFVEMIG